MKLRNFLIVLFAVLMVFAFASCKNEPADPKPQPKPQPQIPDYYQIVVTEGVDKDYWNRDKIKIEWEEEVNAGDTISLKYRSERDVYQWDIRDGSLKWVYETKKGSFTDPVLGEDGWWTLTYTFANDINGAAVDSNERFGVYFRGNYVSTDLFEIKDIYLNDEPLEITQDNIKSYAELAEEPVEHDWTVKNWSVLFATGTVGEVDKTPLAEKVVDGGLVTGAPVNKEGYTLSIFTDAARTIPFDPTQPITEAKIFYYSYVGIPRTVTFNTMGGSPIENEIVANGDMLIAEAEPTFEGKAFKAWYKDEGLTEAWVMTDPVLGDMTLYAAYGDPATVTFQANNGEEPATKIVAIGNPVKMPETPEKELHMFIGWYADAELTTPFNFSEPITADVTVYAKWAVPANVTLNLNYAEAAEPAVVQVAINTAMEEPEAPSRTGFIFEGWYTTAECATEYNFATPVSADIEIFAKWSYGTTYRLTSTKYTSADGNSDDKFVLMWDAATAKVEAGDVFSISFRTTEPFTQYSVRKDNPDTLSKFFHEKSSGAWPLFWSTMTTGADGWTTVTYKFPETSASTQSADIPYEEGGIGFRVYFRNQKMVPNAVMEVRAISLNGVELAVEAANVASYAAPTLETLAEPAEWAVQTVTFNTDGGSAITPAEVEFGAKVAKPADPTKADSFFVGWFEDAECTKAFDFGAAITKATTVYAKWTAPVTLTFDSQSGSAVDAIVTGAGLPINKPADPKRDGFMFGGWFKEAGCTTEFDFAAGIEANTIVYAKWTLAKVITLNLNYTDAPEATTIYVEPGTKAATPSNGVKPGSYFAGWYTAAEGGSLFDFENTAIDADTALYAHWTDPTTYAKMTSTVENKRFTVRYAADVISPKKGDVIAFKYRPHDGTFKYVNIRNAASSDSTAFAKDTNIKDAGFSSATADGDGWYTFCFVFGDTYKSGSSAEYPYPGFIMEMIDSGKWQIGDSLDILGFSYNGEALELALYDNGSYAAPTLKNYKVSDDTLVE